ncbi:Copper-exporting ATPase [Rasamsonia emersonii CBS 393.64]|uniref:P-type Cu(+) transporter n=1 Tax=Rasamsonia emersonii (strain ATCC 16479 / CBS 393.64 / IMI 116815) TaxID=1408163 RepID=A0A0F4YSZ3_RASE3|nr:Copper-exporting ATPase [Rasamsonia emersonii CBS 393.64]KKA20743.1 Copper-exporting ATPase [Rasamsonia emersonii CBS 393.64]
MASSSFDEELESGRWKRAAHMATTTLKVDGMTCGACTSAVEGAFNGVEGAGSVSVSLVMGRAVVHHDPVALPPEKVAEIIEDRGFDAQVLSTDMPSASSEEAGLEGTRSQISTTTLAVEGMTCGAFVEHNASLVTPAQIAEAIEDRGFGATVLDTKTPESSAVASDTAGNKAQLMSTTVSVEGMTCGACTSSVTNAFKDVEGVVQFDISLLAERAVVVHDPQVLPPEKITSIIEDVGFDARVINSTPQVAASQSSKSVRLSIYGLRDAASATSLEDLLRQKNGVASVSVNFSTSRANVVYNPTVVGIRSLVEAIEEAGYNALVSDSEDNNAQLESLSKTKEIQEWRRAFWFSLSFAIPVFLISMIFPMYLHFLDFGKFRIIPGLYLGDLVCLLLTIPVQFGIGKRFYVTSYKALKHRAPTMDVLVMLGTSAAFFFSVFTMIVAICSPPHTRPSTVFDTSTMLITFITLGRWLENRAKGQTSKALSRLMSLTPSMATIYEDPIAAEKAAEEWSASEEKGNTSAPSQTQTVGQKTIPTELIQVGDIVVLRPGDKVSADGIVIRGESYVDESMITGEARPIYKKKGSTVIAGTVNGAGSIDFKVTRAGSDTQLSQIVKLVQDAQTSRAPIQRMADVVAGYFVPVIIALGLLTFVGWMILSHVLPHPPKIFVTEGNGGKVMVCLKLCISVIVFACPCALGLSTPTAVMVGTGVGAEHGILVKGGAALEAATKVNHVVFDKTGTLTEGKMSVAEARLEPTWSSNEWRRKLWWLIVGLAEMSSEHPVAKAIVTAAKEENSLASGDTLDGSVGDFEVSVGKGVFATVEPASGVERMRYRVLLGNAVFLRDNQVKVPEWADPSLQAPDEAASAVSVSLRPNEKTGLTQIHVAIDGQYTGTISLRDALKPSAVATIAALHRMGMSTSLVTGDTYPAALAVAKAVGIPATSVRAGVSPAEKKSIVASYQASGDRVAMVGDGINDSPALATAFVGIALASGTDVAMEAADVVLMRSDDLLAVPASLSLARTIFNRIKLNLMWACVYNVIGLPFAMGLFLPFGGITLHPMAAGAAMAASSVSVVCSSLLLKFWRRPRWMTVERLEKEASLGLTNPPETGKTRWKKSRFSGHSRTRSVLLGSLHDYRTRITRAVFGRQSRQAREEEGYVPLQTVEP